MILLFHFFKQEVSSPDGPAWGRGSVMDWEVKTKTFPHFVCCFHAEKETFNPLLPGIGEMVFSTPFTRVYTCNQDRTLCYISRIRRALTKRVVVKCLNILLP